MTRSATSLLLIALLVPTFAAAQLSPEAMIGLRRVGAPAVSPDGQTVIFTVTEVSLEANRGTTQVFSMPLSGGEPKALTEGPSSSSPVWRPDGRRIGFLRGGQFWEMDPGGGNASQLTDIEGGLSHVKYSPKGTHILFTRQVKADGLPISDDGDVRVITGLMYKHWDNWEDDKVSHVFFAPYSDGKVDVSAAIDIMAGEPYDSPMKPFGGAEQINWSPDGTKIAYTSKKLTGTAYAYSTDSDIYLYDLGTRQTRNLTEGNPGYDTNPVFSPDGRSLVFSRMVTPMYEADRHRLMMLTFASGAVRELSEGFDNNMDNPVFSADGQTIYFLSGTEATVQVFRMNLRARSAVPPVRQVTEGVHDITSLAVAKVGRDEILVGGRMSMSAPVDLFAIDPNNGRMNALTRMNADKLADVALGEVRARWVTTTDGERMKVWVIYPPDFDSTKTYPTLLYAQGGPQGTVSQFFSYRWNFQVMASQGYIVVAPNRRGLPSFGEAWNRQISGDWGGQAMQDMLAAIDHVSTEPYVDLNRRGAVGASFGGYTVFWLAGNHEGRFKTFVSHAGVYNLTSMYGTTEEMFFVDFDLGGAYWESPIPISYVKHSPHSYVANWDTPILMIHGERDYRVPVTQSMEAFTAAQRMGIPSRMVLFPNENHWILSPKNSLTWHRAFYGWLEEWLK
jgi:dipeptidyl aminopeptidase/acylaminoacyl peptidase